MVTSPSKTLLLQASPRDAVAAGDGNTTWVKPAAGVLPPVTGVFMKEKVGRAPAFTVGEAAPELSKVGREKVARVVGVEVGVEVLVGTARAVCVNCEESWATVVPTMAVFNAFTSGVGEGAAPTLQDVSRRAAVSMVIRISRVDFLENMIGTSKSK